MIKVPLRFSYISTFFVSNFYETAEPPASPVPRIAQILPGGGRFHCFFQRADGAENWEKGVDSGIVTLDGIWVTQPEKAKTGLPYFLASLATAMGLFPIAVCPSRRPSPVMTISLFWMNDSREVSSSTIEAPGSRTAFI